MNALLARSCRVSSTARYSHAIRLRCCNATKRHNSSQQTPHGARDRAAVGVSLMTLNLRSVVPRLLKAFIGLHAKGSSSVYRNRNWVVFLFQLWKAEVVRAEKCARLPLSITVHTIYADIWLHRERTWESKMGKGCYWRSFHVDHTWGYIIHWEEPSQAVESSILWVH